MRYFDKNGNEIKSGMTIEHNDGEIQIVYACENDELGINASNEDYLKSHPSAEREYYPLYQFNMKEWSIVDANGGLK